MAAPLPVMSANGVSAAATVRCGMRDNEVGMFTTKVGFAASVRSSRQDPHLFTEPSRRLGPAAPVTTIKRAHPAHCRAALNGAHADPDRG
jgi:hypothetical protein